MTATGKDITRGTYGDVLRRRAAAVNRDTEDGPSADYLAVRNARRRSQFYARWNNKSGVNVVTYNGKVIVRGERPDVYVA